MNIVEEIKKNPYITRKEMSIILNVSIRTIQNIINSLHIILMGKMEMDV